MSDACRQHYKLATGKGVDSGPKKTAGTPGFAKGGAVRKQAGGMTYNKGGKAKR
jgi:hypothetical protein